MTSANHTSGGTNGDETFTAETLARRWDTPPDRVRKLTTQCGLQEPFSAQQVDQIWEAMLLQIAQSVAWESFRRGTVPPSLGVNDDAVSSEDLVQDLTSIAQLAALEACRHYKAECKPDCEILPLVTAAARNALKRAVKKEWKQPTNRAKEPPDDPDTDTPNAMFDDYRVRSDPYVRLRLSASGQDSLSVADLVTYGKHHLSSVHGAEDAGLSAVQTALEHGALTAHEAYTEDATKKRDAMKKNVERLRQTGVMEQETEWIESAYSSMGVFDVWRKTRRGVGKRHFRKSAYEVTKQPVIKDGKTKWRFSVELTDAAAKVRTAAIRELEAYLRWEHRQHNRADSLTYAHYNRTLQRAIEFWPGPGFTVWANNTRIKSGCRIWANFPASAFNERLIYAAKTSYFYTNCSQCGGAGMTIAPVPLICPSCAAWGPWKSVWAFALQAALSCGYDRDSLSRGNDPIFFLLAAPLSVAEPQATTHTERVESASEFVEKRENRKNEGQPSKAEGETFAQFKTRIAHESAEAKKWHCAQGLCWSWADCKWVWTAYLLCVSPRYRARWTERLSDAAFVRAAEELEAETCAQYAVWCQQAEAAAPGVFETCVPTGRALDYWKMPEGSLWKSTPNERDLQRLEWIKGQRQEWEKAHPWCPEETRQPGGQVKPHVMSVNAMMRNLPRQEQKP